MNRFLALYFHWLDATEHRREFTHIYAKDLSEAIAKWSGICSANEQLVHIVPNPTPDQAWKLYDERRAEQWTNRERLDDACLAMDELEKVSRLLEKVKAPKYILDRIEGMECILVEFCTDIDDLIMEDDLNG